MSTETRTDTDVVVIGAGAAGLAAAAAAAESGARVVVLEKTDRIGGAIHGGAGIFAAGSDMQRDRQIPLTRAEAFTTLMDFTQWRVDARLVSDYVNRSADTVAWLTGLGAEFSDVVAYYLGAHATWHYREREAPELTELLAARARELGTEIRTEVPASGLVVEDGRVVGVRFGTGEVLQAAAVVVASGGFGGSPALIEEHTGYRHGTDLFSFAFEELTGDGLRMAGEAGAAPSPTMMETYVSMLPPYFGPGGTAFELGSFRQPNLMLNDLGERFMDEAVMRVPSFAANAVRRQPRSFGYMVLDHAAHEHYLEHGWDFVMSKLPITRPEGFTELVDKIVADGWEHLARVEDIAGLARFVGAPADVVEDSVRMYNAACETGRDDVFHKDARYLRPIVSPPFYVARFSIAGYGSLGGIAVNHRLEAVGTDQRPIPGLFAAGRDANAIYGGSYPFVMSGNSTSFSYNSGRIAGENAATHAVHHQRGTTDDPGT